MGDDYVRSMCHDIEDPTFDATAVATNPRAQVRPVHRPPRVSPGPPPALRVDGPHRRVTSAAEPMPPYHVVVGTVAASVGLEPIDPGDEGSADYAEPLVSDLDFAGFSHSALLRIADEVRDFPTCSPRRAAHRRLW
jgi:hypothetical protein